MAETTDRPIHEKHATLVAAGWKPVTEYQGILTRYLSPDGEGEALHLVWAWVLYQRQVLPLDDRNDPPAL